MSLILCFTRSGHPPPGPTAAQHGYQQCGTATCPGQRGGAHAQRRAHQEEAGVFVVSVYRVLNMYGGIFVKSEVGSLGLFKMYTLKVAWVGQPGQLHQPLLVT